MSKTVLISIRPKWCELIASGKKTIEVRKTAPKIEIPFKCYIYCTKPSFPHEDFLVFDAGKNKAKAFYGGGTIIGEFECDEIKHYVTLHAPDFTPYYMKEEKSDEVSFIDFDETCLTEEDFFEYGSGNDLYGWHISNLIIYDVPKKLSEFTPYCEFMLDEKQCDYRKVKCLNQQDSFLEEDGCNCLNFVRRPPQSWCYVEELT